MGKILLLGILSGFVSTAQANICGSDYQTFNPTTNGLDFATVQSSETLRPCVYNMGVFVHYAVDSVTYSRTINPSVQSGQQRDDELTGMDLSVGMGLNDRWDIGVNVPFVLSQKVEDDTYAAVFEENGATEIKANTKYRLKGDERGGIAAILSVNQNLITDNPFVGEDAGPTFNYEVAADKVIAKNWAAAVNFGYRDRNPGEALPSMPYVPMKDQWIYSVAGSYLFPKFDTKLILELYGSRSAQRVDRYIDRALNSLEALVGVKHDVSQNLAAHAGFTHKVDSSMGGAEWRVYAGVNWAVGRECATTTVEKVMHGPSAPETFKVDNQVLFAHNSDAIDESQVGMLRSAFEPIVSQKFKKIVIEGHTDSVGQAAYNLDLSQRRAENVKRHLIEGFKLASDKVEAQGFGDTQPIADNANYQGRQKNRRVEIKIWR